MRAWVICVLMCVPACFDPVLPAVSCGPEGLCPAGLTCNTTTDVCEIPGNPLAPDADTPPTVDASPVCVYPNAGRFLDPCDLEQADVDVSIDADITYNTTNGKTVTGSKFVPEGELIMVGGLLSRLVYVRSFAIIQDHTFRVLGDHPLVIISGTSLAVEGGIFAASDADDRGPGAGADFDCGQQQGQNAPVGTGGGGGGGFLGGGGVGGSGAGGLEPGGDAGMFITSGFELFRPGCQGGGGAGTQSDSAGGQGGGALMLMAFGAMELDGFIHAGGAGGEGGAIETGGGGGGSGGMIVIEAAEFLASGDGTAIAANGGGGGGGGGSSQPGARGSDALASAEGAQGGPGAPGGGSGGGPGGDGAGLSSPAEPGATASRGGGGGGGSGLIHLDVTGTVSGPLVTSPPPLD